MQYSVKQTSIEQIFNAFANNAIKLKTDEHHQELAIDIPQGNTTKGQEPAPSTHGNGNLNNNTTSKPQNIDIEQTDKVQVKSKPSPDNSHEEQA